MQNLQQPDGDWFLLVYIIGAMFLIGWILRGFLDDVLYETNAIERVKIIVLKDTDHV
jgi:hypothetical protein